MDRDSHVPIRNLKEAKSFLATNGLAFEEVLSSKTIADAIERLGLDYRDRMYSPDLTLWTFLSQVLSEDKSCQAAVVKLIAFLLSKEKQAPSANTAAYSKARGRLTEELLSHLTRQSGKELEEQAKPEWLWRNRHVKLFDGSTISMSDTKSNQEAYPQAKTQKAGVGFPIARLVAIISYSTAAIQDLALGTYCGKGSGEHGLLRELMHNLKSGDVVLGDCYYCTFFLISQLMSLGVDCVFPMHAARTCNFRKGVRLGKKDHVATWKKPQRPAWMDKETYESFPAEIKVREVSVNLSKPGFRAESRVLVTTFLDPKQTNKKDLAELYDRRWFVELDLRAIKQTMKMDILRAKTPEMVRKEIWAHLLGYNLVRKVMAQAAHCYNKNPRQLSFKLAVQVIDTFRNIDLFDKKNEKVYKSILSLIAYKRVGDRGGRSEPRKVKRRRKPFPLLQKSRHHYHQEVA